MPRAWTDPLVPSKQWKSDVRFGTCNVRSLYWSRTLRTVAKKLVGDKLEEVRWYNGGAL